MLEKIIHRMGPLNPRALVSRGKRKLGYIAAKLYALKYKPFVIRKDTSDITVFTSIFFDRELRLPIKLAPKLIIDGGAYIGLSALYFSSKYPNAKIIAVEPEESNFKVLEINTRSVPSISRIQAGLYYKNCPLKITDRNTGKWGFMTKEVGEREDYDVQATTISDILKKSGFERIDILKLDIESAEKELFSRDYESWLSKVDVIIIELHDRIKEGCTDTFNAAVNKYHWDYRYKKGEKIVLIRKK